jgi:hypothetical protein
MHATSDSTRIPLFPTTSLATTSLSRHRPVHRASRLPLFSVASNLARFTYLRCIPDIPFFCFLLLNHFTLPGQQYLTRALSVARMSCQLRNTLTFSDLDPVVISFRSPSS